MTVQSVVPATSTNATLPPTDASTKQATPAKLPVAPVNTQTPAQPITGTVQRLSPSATLGTTLAFLALGVVVDPMVHRVLQEFCTPQVTQMASTIIATSMAMGAVASATATENKLNNTVAGLVVGSLVGAGIAYGGYPIQNTNLLGEPLTECVWNEQTGNLGLRGYTCWYEGQSSLTVNPLFSGLTR